MALCMERAYGSDTWGSVTLKFQDCIVDITDPTSQSQPSSQPNDLCDIVEAKLIQVRCAY